MGPPAQLAWSRGRWCNGSSRPENWTWVAGRESRWCELCCRATGFAPVQPIGHHVHLTGRVDLKHCRGRLPARDSLGDGGSRAGPSRKRPSPCVIRRGSPFSSTSLASWPGTQRLSAASPSQPIPGDRYPAAASCQAREQRDRRRPRSRSSHPRRPSHHDRS